MTWNTGWRRLIGSPKLQIIFHKRATKYRSLLQKMTCKDKGSYESSPPCSGILKSYTSYIIFKSYIISVFVRIDFIYTNHQWREIVAYLSKSYTSYTICVIAIMLHIGVYSWLYTYYYVMYDHQIHTHTYIYIYIYVYMKIYIYICVIQIMPHIGVYSWLYTYYNVIYDHQIHTHTYIYMYIYVYMNIYIYICVIQIMPHIGVYSYRHYLHIWGGYD